MCEVGSFIDSYMCGGLILPVLMLVYCCLSLRLHVGSPSRVTSYFCLLAKEGESLVHFDDVLDVVSN